MIRRAPSRATSSSTSLSSRPEPNRASISPRIFSVGDTRDGTGVVLPVQTLAVLYGTYARRHLHRRMDTAVGWLCWQRFGVVVGCHRAARAVIFARLWAKTPCPHQAAVRSRPATPL